MAMQPPSRQPDETPFFTKFCDSTLVCFKEALNRDTALNNKGLIGEVYVAQGELSLTGTSLDDAEGNFIKAILRHHANIQPDLLNSMADHIVPSILNFPHLAIASRTGKTVSPSGEIEYSTLGSISAYIFLSNIALVFSGSLKITAYPFRSSDFLVHLDNDKSRTISERFSRIP